MVSKLTSIRTVDDVIVVKKSEDGTVWYLPAYVRCEVKLSRASDWERIVLRVFFAYL